MDAQELFWGNKRVAKLLQTAMAEFFAKRGVSGVETPEAVFAESPEAIDTDTFLHLRINGKKESFPISLGSRSPGFEAAFNAALGGVPAEPKQVVKEFVQAVWSALDPELKAHSMNVDPSGVLAIQGKGLCGWQRVSAARYLKIPFKFANGTELTFEIAMTDSAYQRKKSLELFGLPQESRILVVDDSATTRKLSRHYLSTMGYLNVEESVDGQAALTKLLGSNPRFNLVVADWHMPNLSGLDLLKAVRADAELKALPLILATGERNAAEVTSAIKGGVSGYVVKPFEADTLFSAIRKAMPMAPAMATAPKKVA